MERSKDAIIKELQDKLAFYEQDHAAKFYTTLTKALDHVNTELNNKTLNLDQDTFASSVITLADKSPKIIDFLVNGRVVISPEKKADSSEEKKKKKAEDRVAI